MSDNDDFMQDSDNEEYDFEYEDDDDDDTGDAGVENKYYNAKQMKVDNPEEAIDEFLRLPAQEETKGDWGFRSLKQAIKLEFSLNRYDQALEHYRELLTYVKSAVTRNYSEKSINNLLDYVEKGSHTTAAADFLERFYFRTLESFQATNNERLWLKTNIKLARLWLEKKDWHRLRKKLRELHQACQLDDGSDDPNKGTFSLETYALEIQMYSEIRNNKRLKSLYQRALRVKSAVPHPKIQGVIRECGGKMHMSEENWKEAQVDFFEAFRNYDEAGSLKRIQVLKYLVLVTMLTGSDINPFDSQETKPYQNDHRISAMTDLVDAYQRDDVLKYESVLADHGDLLDDPFIAENIDEVTRSMRMKGVMKLIAPYTRFSVAFVAKKLKLSPMEAQAILGFLIVEGKLQAKINQELGTVEVDRFTDAARTEAVSQWSKSLKDLWQTLLDEGTGFKAEDPAMYAGMHKNAEQAPKQKKPGRLGRQSNLRRGTKDRPSVLSGPGKSLRENEAHRAKVQRRT